MRGQGPVYQNRDMHLDSQGMMNKTEEKKAKKREENVKKGEEKMQWYNLQVHVNNGCTHTTLKNAAPGTVARVECLVDDPWTAQQIRDCLKASVTGWFLPRPRNG